MRGIIGIQSRREVQLTKGPGVYCNAVIKGQEGQVEFGCYDIKIQPHLQIGTSVDIEWDEKPGKPFNDQPTTQRTIRQLYIDGKPVVEKAQGKGTGGGYKDSPETRASIEAQTAVNAVVELLKINQPQQPDDAFALLQLRGKVFAWCSMKLDAVLGKSAASPTEKQAPKAGPDATPVTLKAQFVAAAKAKGYTFSTAEGLEAVNKWLSEHHCQTGFDGATLEAQKRLIDEMKHEKQLFQ